MFLQVIHNDMHTKNILVSKSRSRLVLTDFGLAADATLPAYFRAKAEMPRKEMRPWSAAKYNHNGKCCTVFCDYSVDMFSLVYLLLHMLFGYSGRIVHYAMINKRMMPFSDLLELVNSADGDQVQDPVHLSDSTQQAAGGSGAPLGASNIFVPSPPFFSLGLSTDEGRPAARPRRGGRPRIRHRGPGKDRPPPSFEEPTPLASATSLDLLLPAFAGLPSRVGALPQCIPMGAPPLGGLQHQAGGVP